jgi:hypothetical protein
MEDASPERAKEEVTRKPSPALKIFISYAPPDAAFKDEGALRKPTYSLSRPAPLAREARPLIMALQQHRAVHRAFWIQGRDGVTRKIEATAFPLEGQGRRQLGAVSIFWPTGAP